MSKKNHGTTNLGQFTQISAAVTKALPKAIDGIDPKLLIAALNKSGKKLEEGLVQLFNDLIADAGSTIKLLNYIGTISIPATTEPFVVEDYFVVNTDYKASAKISYLGDNFKQWFFGKTQQSLTEASVNYYELDKDSVDGPIIKELGGEQKAETTLSEIFTLMKRQRNGEDGVLLTSGYANIFYVRGANGVLRAVSVGWGGDGWDVRADSVEDPDRWGAGFQVFASNS